jgi:hypothetical protein
VKCKAEEDTRTVEFGGLKIYARDLNPKGAA